MNETTLLLSPDPGNPNAKADFLATVEPIHLPRKTTSTQDVTLPFEITFDGYTRESWASASTCTKDEWKSCYLLSTDGRNRLPGFLKYLRDRKKAAFAKFDPITDVFSSSEGSQNRGRAVLVVPFDPPTIADEDLPGGVERDQLLFVMYLRDENVLTNKNNPQQKQQPQQQMLRQNVSTTQQQNPQSTGHAQPSSKAVPPIKPIQINPSKKGGLLGNLLGARQRTENHLAMVRGPTRTDPSDSSALTSGAAGVITSFRNRVSTELEQFQSDPTTFITKITISLSSLVKQVPLSERDKVTMDVLKYVVYEQVEEVGMDRWIAAKEPGAFMDECVIAVYKEGHCPQEVLEDLNRGELPDEIKGQARHLAEAQSKMVQRKDKKVTAEEVMKKNVKEEANVTVLNTNKRDRRTLEQIQKDLISEKGDEKRSRFE
ncbi:hypothetical protein HJC23_000666 [Cyclotella cryptica]|uniref:Uncharacterized protein n=1 Tax=Cyclotella cryptica TaxID=29204 RepID=A0ABD3Q6X7_9STRA|eukprot:CCRYP_008053-RA/>CCRYP_008053-RA protein AED:0.05 eAED:0.05 QI:0/-1/0/1/-1/1/1/0/429